MEGRIGSRVGKARDKLLSNWWVMVIRGSLLILAGIFTIALPGRTLVSVIWFLGLYWFVDGVIGLIEGIRGEGGKKRGWAIISALIGMLAGLLVIANPLIAGVVSSTLLAYLIGITVLFRGLTLMFTGRNDQWTWKGLLAGIVYVLFGIVVIARPLVAVVVLMWILAILALIAGVASIWLGFRMRALRNAVGEIIQDSVSAEAREG